MRDQRWGLRHLEEIIALAEDSEMMLDHIVEMPANNLSVTLRRVSVRASAG